MKRMFKRKTEKESKRQEIHLQDKSKTDCCNCNLLKETIPQTDSAQERTFSEWQRPVRDWLQPVSDWQRPLAQWQLPLLDW